MIHLFAVKRDSLIKEAETHIFILFLLNTSKHVVNSIVTLGSSFFFFPPFSSSFFSSFASVLAVVVVAAGPGAGAPPPAFKIRSSTFLLASTLANKEGQKG